MDYYNTMFEAISHQYESGIITYEQASELNHIAYEYANSEYSKEKEDAYLREYKSKKDEFEKSLKELAHANPETLSKEKAKSMINNAEKKLDAVDDMLSAQKMPEIMSANCIKKSDIIKGAIVGAAVWVGVLGILKKCALNSLFKEVRAKEDRIEKIQNEAKSSYDRRAEEINKEYKKLYNKGFLLEDDDYEKLAKLKNDEASLKIDRELDQDSFDKHYQDIDNKYQKDKKIIKRAIAGAQVVGAAAAAGSASSLLLTANRNNAITFRNIEKKKVDHARKKLADIKNFASNINK